MKYVIDTSVQIKTFVAEDYGITFPRDTQLEITFSTR